MSNTITAYFKGRTGVAESVYQNDYGIIMAFDGIYLPAHFDCYFSVTGSNEAIPGIGADNRVAIPNAVLANSGKVEIHIPLHTGESDSEVEYVVYFKVIGRARPEDDGTPEQMTAIEQALALLQTPIGNIEEIVNEALSFTGETFDEMQAALDADQAAFKEEVRGDIADVEADFAVLQGQYDTAVAALTVDSEVEDVRVGDDGVTYTTAGEAVRTQFSDLKAEIKDIYTNDNIGVTIKSAWESGSISTTNGGTFASDSKIRTSGFENCADFVSGKVLIKAISGFHGAIYFYSAKSSSSFISATKFATGVSAVDIPPTANYYKVTLADASDSSSITTSDSSNANLFDISTLKQKVDKTDYIANIMNISNIIADLSEVVWEKGSISSTTGTTMNSTTRIRTTAFIDVSTYNAVSIVGSVLSGYKFWLARYSTADASGFISGVGFNVGTKTIDVLNAKYIKVVVADTSDSSSISASDGAKFGMSLVYPLEKKINDIEDYIGGIPSYWQTYFNSKTPTLNGYDADLGRDGVSFAFVTDIHVLTNNMMSPKLLKYISKNTNVKRVVCGGDIITGYNTKSVAIGELESWMRETSDLEIINLHGNHDNNSNSQTDPAQVLTDGEFYGLACRQSEQFVTFEENALYGYSDNENQKVRYIYLDTGAPDSAVISNTQLAWMTDRISELSAEWTVIIFTHQFWSGASSETETLTLDNNGTAILNKMHEIYNTINATIACIISGHCHRNYSMTSEDGIPCIATTTDSGGYNSSAFDPDTPNRTAGTTTEQAFDLFYINTSAKTIKVVRIGAGDTAMDRTFSY